MRKKTRIFVLAALLLAFAASLTILLTRGLDYRRGAEVYAEAETLVHLPELPDAPTALPEAPEAPETAKEPETAPQPEKPVYVDPYADALRNMDFAALRAVNPDVVGWILIPGTAISYPLVQGEDNQYYLDRTWKKTKSAVGAIFMESTNDRSFQDFNTIIYGHRMNNGSMFAALKNYRKQAYWSAHPTVYITDDNGSRAYEIFAAYEVSTQGDTYRLGLTKDEQKQAFLDSCTERSVISTGVVPTVYDQILTLSTCTGNGHATRWVVQARLPGSVPEKAEEAVAETQEAPSEMQEAPPDMEEAIVKTEESAAAQEIQPEIPAEAAINIEKNQKDG